METDLTPKQIAAITQSIKLGRTLQGICGDAIIELYRSGMSESAVAETLCIARDNATSESVAAMAVHNFLAGHKGFANIQGYEGILVDEERKVLVKDHKYKANVQNGLTQGRRCYEKKNGVFGLSTAEMKENSSKAGKTAYRLKVGIHAMTTEQISEANRKTFSARSPEKRRQFHYAGAVAKGYVPWLEEEIETLQRLSVDPAYQWQTGPNRGTPQAKKIAETLNTIYHSGKQVQTARRVNRKFEDLRKSLENRCS
ncbi:MAG: hypothetical protein Q7R56_01875 [Nanoarchaeota archaeon]|nr:hypothetical protein [Nanoarchaeota archaeon]